MLGVADHTPGPHLQIFQASSLLDNVLEEDLPPGAPSFLEGRALWVASRSATHLLELLW